ncbi:uncharacterized protein EV420DRAFT_257526 [Desarmillaria tabescens]|uniref:Uncharacterized protein n=1 Tax=Armillaria tabescens TaxID=1929756 RepID=A0AA39KHP0_ARMTA|nr:uncharacterized protein EV420DRAFT_257526 [Desarmillaria tabescens]KAK0460275.1 hypothetical protein EV420DRAFT_257526 [Desarmillaria tabescens]
MESIPWNLSLEERQDMLEALDVDLNRMILEAYLQGLYTGIFSVALWTMFSRSTFGRKFLVVIIVMLYLLATIGFSFDWAFVHRAFVGHGNNLYTVFKAAELPSPWWIAFQLIDGITGGIGTFLVDITIVWRCWVIWDRQWRIVLFPTFCAVAGTVAKMIQLVSILRYETQSIEDTEGSTPDPQFDFSVIYLSLTLVTTLSCTALIVYRILRVTGVHSYCGILEALIESSAIYSMSLIIYLVLVICGLDGCFYADIFMMYIKSIAPTLLVARVASKSRRGDTSKEDCDRDVHQTYPDPETATIIICRCHNFDGDGERDCNDHKIS